MGIRRRTRFRWRLETLAGTGLAVLLVFSGCSFTQTGTLPEVQGRILQESREDWGRIVVDENQCVLVNNVWNKSAAGGALNQGVFIEEVGGNKTVGWRWRSPWHLVPRVVSQPELVCGDKPWDEPLRLRPEFPFRAGSKRLSADFKVKLRASGAYNMAFSMWAVSSLPASRSGITHEIMIWIAHDGQTPAGTRRDALDVGGKTYDVYVKDKHADASGSVTNVWTYAAFVAREPVLGGPLALGAFIDYMLQHGILAQDSYLTSLELGSEVSQGMGTVEVQGFALTSPGQNPDTGVSR
ncbi:MAG TPA: hypothetical protein VKM93_12440 [Terriglobia bacterium]|nr:hypothetical protein [Terriglobia bacterium]